MLREKREAEYRKVFVNCECLSSHGLYFTVNFTVDVPAWSKKHLWTIFGVGSFVSDQELGIRICKVYTMYSVQQLTINSSNLITDNKSPDLLHI